MAGPYRPGGRRARLRWVRGPGRSLRTGRRRLKRRGRSGEALAAAAGALGSLDTALNVAFPDLIEGFDITVGELQWVVVAFVLSYGAALLAAGQLGDAIDHRLLVLAGAVVSAAAMAGCAAAPDFGWFLGFRVAQGLGTAAVMAGAPALATAAAVARGPADGPVGGGQGRALGVFTASTGIGAAAGPVVGGPLVELGGWPTVFWFRVPLSLAVAGLAVLVGGAHRARADARTGTDDTDGTDLVGALLLAAALTGGLLVIGSGQRLGFGSVPVWVALVVVLASTVTYRRRASRLPHPILPPGLLGWGPVGLVAALAVTANGTMFVAWLLVPTLAIDHLAADPWSAGLALAAAPLAMALTAPLGGRWVDRSGSERPLVVGLALETVGLAGLAGAGSAGGLVAVGAAMAVVGTGLGLFGVAYLDRILVALPADRRGTAGALALLLRTIGIVVGVSASSALFGLLEPGRGFLSAYRLTTSASAGMAALAVVVALVGRTGRPGPPGTGLRPAAVDGTGAG